jgi:hypothetical protein
MSAADKAKIHKMGGKASGRKMSAEEASRRGSEGAKAQPTEAKRRGGESSHRT